ncbi:hypothetical protein GCM10009864_52440 [Streptomyces lunalinharesii]|uniref:Secreted protein n=1 Tax=Streptomyces lunalinharesii TaxID=333384 RepID=A0ABP6ERE0_9ACTN
MAAATTASVAARAHTCSGWSRSSGTLGLCMVLSPVSFGRGRELPCSREAQGSGTRPRNVLATPNDSDGV